MTGEEEILQAKQILYVTEGEFLNQFIASQISLI